MEGAARARGAASSADRIEVVYILKDVKDEEDEEDEKSDWVCLRRLPKERVGRPTCALYQRRMASHPSSMVALTLISSRNYSRSYLMTARASGSSSMVPKAMIIWRA